MRLTVPSMTAPTSRSARTPPRSELRRPPCRSSPAHRRIASLPSARLGRQRLGGIGQGTGRKVAASRGQGLGESGFRVRSSLVGSGPGTTRRGVWARLWGGSRWCSGEWTPGSLRGADGADGRWGILARPLPLRVADVLGVGNGREVAGVCGCVVVFRWSERVRWPAGRSRQRQGGSSGPWPGTCRPCRGSASCRHPWTWCWLSARSSIPLPRAAGS
jgi:hypothetical protein